MTKLLLPHGRHLNPKQTYKIIFVYNSLPRWHIPLWPPLGKVGAIGFMSTRKTCKRLPDIRTTKHRLAHKVISFTLSDQQERGPSYWKMNSSVLRDRPYVIMIEETVNNINNLGITDVKTWWNVFLTCVRSKTVIYTKRKHFLDASIRKRFSDEMVKLEAISQDMMTAQQHNRYRTLQESLKGYEEKEIEGYRTRTRGLPKYEMHEPNIEFFAKLEKRRAKNIVIGELQDIDGSVFSDRENLLRITAKFYCQVLHPTIHFISNK